MAKDIIFDPQTTKELDEATSEQYGDFCNTVLENGIDLDELDSQEIASMFFVNGFMRGLMAMHKDENLRETVLVMDDEIKIQTGE